MIILLNLVNVLIIVMSMMDYFDATHVLKIGLSGIIMGKWTYTYKYENKLYYMS